jgi:hypothetical protein
MGKSASNADNVRGIVLDPVTLEHIDTIIVGDRIVRAAETAKKKNAGREVSYKECLFQKFKKTNIEECRMLVQELSSSEKSLLFALIQYVGYEDAIIQHVNGLPMVHRHMAEVSGMSLRTVDDAVRSLVSKMLLAKDTVGGKKCYRLNPWVASSGSRFDKQLIGLFADYPVRSREMKLWKDIDGKPQEEAHV